MLSNAVAQSSSGAVANLQREQCLSMGGRRRKSSASISEQIGVLATYGTLSRSMLVYHHDQMQANAVSQRAVWVLVPRPLNYRLSDAVSAHVAPRNGGASVSAANGVHEASETLSSSFALRHNDQAPANAVLQRAVWVLVPRSLNYRLSSAAPAHAAPRNGGASVSAANGVHEASEALSSSFALRHHAWMQANAVSQRAVWVLVLRSLNYRLSDAVSTHAAPRNGGTPVSGA